VVGVLVTVRVAVDDPPDLIVTVEELSVAVGPVGDIVGDIGI